MAFLRDGKKTMYVSLVVFAASIVVLAYSVSQQYAGAAIQPTSVDPQSMRYTPLSANQIKELEQNGWEVVDGKLYKTFQFGSFVDAFQFMYRVGVEAERMNHHPDWTNNYGAVSVYLYTWSAGNQITDYDARLAAVMDREAGQ
jgi:4a-hydroxytetrahydrobiopterin dehydratase